MGRGRLKFPRRPARTAPPPALPPPGRIRAVRSARRRHCSGSRSVCRRNRIRRQGRRAGRR